MNRPQFKEPRGWILHLNKSMIIFKNVQVLLSAYISPVFATGAFIVPTSLYFLLKVRVIEPSKKVSLAIRVFALLEFSLLDSQKFVVKPYMQKREKRKALENMEKTYGQVIDYF